MVGMNSCCTHKQASNTSMVKKILRRPRKICKATTMSLMSLIQKSLILGMGLHQFMLQLVMMEQKKRKAVKTAKGHYRMAEQLCWHCLLWLKLTTVCTNTAKLFVSLKSVCL